MGGTGLEPEGPPGQEGGEGAVKASQLNPICLLMKAVLHGMCESWGPGKRQVGFPFTYGSQRASRHEGVGGRGGFSALGLERQELWVPPTSPVLYQYCGLGQALLSKEVVR